jgi:CubicO group peptidase (beta-lactamase class C family)
MRFCRLALAIALIFAPEVASVSVDANENGWPAVSPATAVGAAAATGADLTSADLNIWSDGIVPRALAGDDIAGAVVVVVRNGNVIFQKGYGYSDVASRRSVNPETTLFRVASVSKLFTWTAVMQQVELGRLNLDTDINKYLDFRIPDTWPRPITLRNLMTHTSGFEEANKNTYAVDAASIPQLGSLLKSWIPERIYPPGEVVAYSNYGAALAGYIVERASHERFEEYAAHHILAPLGMKHSTFVQPVPHSLAGDLSQGYVLGSQPPSSFEFVELRPAGGLSATGADMARFMIAHLDDGAFGGNRILKSESTVAMHAEAYRPDSALPGMGLGFWHVDRNGHVIVAHTGDTVLFHTGLYLVLDARTGLFVSENSAGGKGDFPHDIFLAFMERYFPGRPPTPAATLQTALADGRKIAGTYENSRRADSNFMIAEEISNERTVTLNPDATISLSGSNDSNGKLRKWREIAPFRWREMNGDRVLDAEIRDGRVAAVMTDASAPISILMPASFWRSASWNVPLFLGTIAVLALTVLFWPLAAILRWLLGRSNLLAGRTAAWRLMPIVALVDLVFLSGWAEFLSYTDNHIAAMSAANDWILHLLQAIGAIAVVGIVVPLYAVARAVPARDPPWWSKLSGALTALACISTVWFAFSLKLLSWSVAY